MSTDGDVERAVFVKVEADGCAFKLAKVGNVVARSSGRNPLGIEACRVKVALRIANDAIAVEANDEFVSCCNVANTNVLNIPANIALRRNLRDWSLEIALCDTASDVWNDNDIRRTFWKVHLSVAGEVDSVDLESTCLRLRFGFCSFLCRQYFDCRFW